MNALESRVLCSLTVPAYDSLSTASVKLYLDFDGDNTTNWGGTYSPGVTPAYSTDADTANFSSTELTNILEIFNRVSEKFSPFNIDVTTVDPGTYLDGQAERIVIGGSGAWAGGGGGINWIGGFTNSSSNTGYVFPDNLGTGNPAYVSDAIAHEMGHALGLQHQSEWSGSSLVQKYSDNDPTTTGTTYSAQATAPIMGISYYATRGLWWSGTPETSSTATQDDLAIISDTTSNGFGYRSEDYGDTWNSTAVGSLTLSGTSLTGSGVITTTSDWDYFSFTTGAGSVSLTISPSAYGGMLDSQATIIDSSGNVVASGDSGLGTTLTATVLAGTYYVGVGSHGSYGDVGQYTISGTVPAAGALTIIGTAGNDTISIDSTSSGISVTANGSTTWYTSGISSIVVNAGDGNDTVSVTSNVTLPTTLNGGNGDDVLTGGSWKDSIDGGAGNDTIAGGVGTDTLVGGVGVDTVDYSYLPSTQGVNVALTTGTFSGDIYTGSALTESDSLSLFENANGGAGWDILTTSLSTGSVLIGNGGNDYLGGGTGNDSLDGGAGDDTVAGGAGADTLIGGSGIDTVDYSYLTSAYGVNVTLATGTYTAGVWQGATLIETDSLSLFENANGGAGYDTLATSLTTGCVLRGNGANDTLTGGSGNDSLDGGDGNDSISGGDGNDTIIGGWGTDTLIGGNGVDTVAYSYLTSAYGVNLNLTTGTYTAGVWQGATWIENDSLSLFENADGGAGYDILATSLTTGSWLRGFGADDVITGGTGNDTLDGGAGNDSLNGGIGNDSLIGSDGNDTITGGAGNDTLDGGNGDDLFYAFGDGYLDTVYGGAGTDTAHMDTTDIHPNSDIETILNS